MLQSLIARVQRSFRSVLGDVALRALLTLPFLIALGFAIAAGAEWVYHHFGTQEGNLAIAGGFAALGLVLLGFYSLRQSAADSVSPQPEQATQEPLPAESNILSKFFADVDAELLLSLAGTLLPILMPRREAVLRSLPILAVIGLIVLVALRSSSSTAGRSSPESEGAGPEPGIVPDLTPAGA
jgi:hypothetical protein